MPLLLHSLETCIRSQLMTMFGNVCVECHDITCVKHLQRMIKITEESFIFRNDCSIKGMIIKYRMLWGSGVGGWG